jgi:uncharacterized repeat protein (TIGR01451 family)
MKGTLIQNCQMSDSSAEIKTQQFLQRSCRTPGVFGMPEFDSCERLCRYVLWLVVTALLCANSAPAAAFWPRDEVRVYNVIPNSMSAEEEQNSEPSLAVAPIGMTPGIIIGSFDNASSHPYFRSFDNGVHWQSFTSLDHQGATVEWDPSPFAYVARVNFGQSAVLRCTDPGGSGVFSLLPGSEVGPDTEQPWLAVVRRGSVDRIYMGFNDMGRAFHNGHTARVRFSLDGGAHWTTTVIEHTGNRIHRDGPAVRVAPAKTGDFVYALFTRFDSIAPGGAGELGDVVIMRSDNAGSDLFSALGTIGRGVSIANNIVLPGQNNVMGPQEMRSGIALAVSPKNPNTVYVAYTEIVPFAGPRLKVKRSVDAGETWTSVLSTSIPQNVPSSLPALAVAEDEAVGLLFTTFEIGRFTTKFVRVESDLAARIPKTLCQFSPFDPRPRPGDLPYIGRYQDLESLGNKFYGTFSAGNRPVPSHFPSHVHYQRCVEVDGNVISDFDLTAPGRLAKCSPDQFEVFTSIDPFFFLYSPGALPKLDNRPDLPDLDPGKHFTVISWPDCSFIDCCPSCPSPGPDIFPEVTDRLGPDAVWSKATNVITQTDGQFQMIVDTRSSPRAFYRLAMALPTNSAVTIQAATGEFGSLSPTGSVVVPVGQTLFFTATPILNYGVDQWFVDGEPVQTGGTNFALTKITSKSRVTVTFAPLDDLAMTAFAPAAPVAVGDPFVYALSVANTGARTSSAVAVSYKLPTGMNFLSATASQGSWTQAVGIVTFNLGTLSRGTEALIQIQLSANSVGLHTNLASVMGSAFEMDTNNNASMTIITAQEPPLIMQHPASTNAPAGQAVMFTVLVTGTPVLDYQWYFNDNYLPSQTNSFLILSPVQTNQAGLYRARVRNEAGLVFSDPATLSVP